MRMVKTRQSWHVELEVVTHHSLESPKADLLPLFEDEHHEFQTLSLNKELPAPAWPLLTI